MDDYEVITMAGVVFEVSAEDQIDAVDKAWSLLELDDGSYVDCVESVKPKSATSTALN